MLQAMADGIAHRGKVPAGDKTLLDACSAALLSQAMADGIDQPEDSDSPPTEGGA